MTGQTFQTLLVGVLCLSVAGLSAVTVKQHQHLATLQTTLDNQPDLAGAQRRQMEALESAQSTLRSELKQLSQSQEALNLAQERTRAQIDEVATALQTGSQHEVDPMDASQVRAWQARLEQAEHLISELQVRHAQPATTSVSPAPARLHAAKKSPPPAAPFSLIGIELRGGVRFVSALARGARTLTAVQLAQIGDLIEGWRLQSLSSDTAVFKVPGHPEQSIAIP